MMQQPVQPMIQQPRMADYLSESPRRLNEIRPIQQEQRTNKGMIIFLVILLIVLIGGLIFMVWKGQALLDTLLQSSP